MKKNIYLISAVALVVTLASCKKDYMCNCHIETSTGGQMSSSTPIFDSTYDDAQEKCSNIEANCNLTKM